MTFSEKLSSCRAATIPTHGLVVCTAPPVVVCIGSALGLANVSYGKTITIHSVIPGDQLGRILVCLGHRNLWGPKGAVARSLPLNDPHHVRKAGNLIRPRHLLKLPLPEGREIASEDEIMACARGPSGEPPAVPSDDSIASEPENEADRAALKSTLAASEKPAAVAAAKQDAASSTPSAEPSEESPRADRENIRYPWWVGLDTSLFFLSSNASGVNASATLAGFSVSGGHDVLLTRKWRGHLDGQLFALAVSGPPEALRPFELRASVSRDLELADVESRVRFGAIYSTVFGASAGPAYQNLFGLSATGEVLLPDAAGAWLGRVDVAFFSGDVAALTQSNWRVDATVGYQTEQSFENARWNYGLLCRHLHLGGFTNGRGVVHTLGAYGRYRF